MRRAHLARYLAPLFLLSGCVQGGELGVLAFDDNESPRLVGDDKFAVGDILSVHVTTNEVIDLASLVGASSDTAVLEVEPGLASDIRGGLTLTATVVGEGSADIEVRDAAGLIVDKIQIDAAAATELSVEPLQFGLTTGKLIGERGIDVFSVSNAPLFTRLRENANDPASLKGQLSATGSSSDPLVGLRTDGAEQFVGELFSGDLSLTPEAAFSLTGGQGSAVVTLAAGDLVRDIPVNVIPLDPNGAFAIRAVGVDPNGQPAQAGAIGGVAFRLDGDAEVEIFGGFYIFSEVVAQGAEPLLRFDARAQDSALFTAIGTGDATVEIGLENPLADGPPVKTLRVTFPVTER
jgi:hypothetical protein